MGFFSFYSSDVFSYMVSCCFHFCYKRGRKKLVRKIAENYALPYFTISPTFSICPVHGYIEGEHYTCPKCVVKQKCEVYSRVVGYIRPVQQWNEGKQAEFEDRKEFALNR